MFLPGLLFFQVLILAGGQELCVRMISLFCCHSARDRRHVFSFGDFHKPVMWRRKRRPSMARTASWLILFLAAALNPPVFAVAGQAPSDSLRECQALIDNAARLFCYDNVLENHLPTPQAVDNEVRHIDNNEMLVDNNVLLDVRHDEKGESLLDSRWELRRESKRGVFHLRPYKPVYVAPFSWVNKRNTTPSTPNPNTTVTQPMNLDKTEAEFQLSLKFKIVEGMFGKNFDLWGAYTQSSRWQSYNDQDSRPFRETNHEPEILLVTETDYSVLGWRGRLLGFGVNHQSNGRSEPLSRSWNRAVLLAGFERENWTVTVRAWRCIDGPSGRSDNPDLPDYAGRFDVTVARVLGGHQFSVMARHSLKTGSRSHGAAQLEWAFPVRTPLRGRIRVFHGYGESLVDYNFKTTLISLGISLVEWF